MRRTQNEILDHLHRNGGVLMVGRYRTWAPTISRMVAASVLVPLLPGVVAVAGDDRLWTRLLAVAGRYPDAVVTGRAAAAMTFWPDLAVTTVEVARRIRAPRRDGFEFTRRVVAESWVEMTGPVRHTTPAATAVELCAQTVGADAIDQVLRRRAASLAQLHAALEQAPGRVGNVERLRLLIDSRDEPWSAAERLAHQVLRSAGLTGWVGNHEVRIGSRRYYLDVAFPGRRLAIEVESVAFHSSPAQLHADRLRQNLLSAAGWTVLRIDWRMLTERPEAVIRLIRAALG